MKQEFGRVMPNEKPMQEKRTVQLHYPLERLTEPVVTRLVTDFDLEPNILRADVDAHSGGWLSLELTGSGERITAALDWLRGQGLVVAEGAQA